MPTGDYERYRLRLDAQLRADVELIYEAYRAKLRAYETVARARGEDFVSLPAAELPFALPPAPAPEPPPRLVSAPPAAPARSPAHQVEGALLAVWDQLPEVFDRADLVKLLGLEPRRSTLHRVLLRYVREGALEREDGPGGRYLLRYRKLQAPS
jgi:hypothetical protein